MYTEYCLDIDVSIERVIEGVVVKVSALSFLGDVDKETGTIVSYDSGCFGCSIVNKILVVEKFRGSTVGTYILYSLCRKGLSPKAILCSEPDPVVVAGAAICEIPMVYAIPLDILQLISTGDRITISMKGDKLCISLKKAS
ncbi:MAG: DUF126 domain-containing protein [Ignisphaera sp.]